MSIFIFSCLLRQFNPRSTYGNASAVAEQVAAYQSQPNLLLWYTADEPDGSLDPPSLATDSYSIIASADPYHPVSLVLNCQDYMFGAYAAGADIVLQDTYEIGANTTWSLVWDTPCTVDFGVCGCDNCKGVLEDVSDRVDEFLQRLDILGWELQKTVWSVPQGFGEAKYVCFVSMPRRG
jgi:hypothetical protein